MNWNIIRFYWNDNSIQKSYSKNPSKVLYQLNLSVVHEHICIYFPQGIVRFVEKRNGFRFRTTDTVFLQR